MRRSEQGFTLIEIMVVIAIIATLVAAVSLGIPLVKERSQKLQCQRNLADLGTLFTTYRLEKPGKPKYSGVALFLWFRMKKDVPKGEEEKLLCPGDQSAKFPSAPEDRDAYDDITLSDPPTDMCSYAVRDFNKYPLKQDAGEKQIVACDRQGQDNRTMHHKDGLMVLWDNGGANFMDREGLGLSIGSEDPIVVGPDSEQPFLKQVIVVAESKE